MFERMQQVGVYIEKGPHIDSLGTIKSETLSDRDAGFCSGEETDLDIEYHSQTETSRDSIDTKDSVNTFPRCQGKRKADELKKECPLDEVPEFKKIKVESGLDSPGSDSIKSDACPLSAVKEEEVCSESVRRLSPFRPWDIESPGSRDSFSAPCAYQPLCANFVQEEPLALVVEKKKNSDDAHYHSYRPPPSCESLNSSQENSTVDDLRLGQRPHEVVRLFQPDDCEDIKSKLLQDSSYNRFTSSSSTMSADDKRQSSQSSSHQRNYKSMTRERRIEANARERTRVHTISAAFETLRKCVPSYANNQKLSKLSVLRIACSYIMTLSRMAGHDYSEDHSAPSIENCIEAVCNTIQLEGKTRKKKDE